MRKNVTQPPPCALKIALVGHTNTGKTSVMRSLLRDRSLGDVQDAAGTTTRSVGYPMLVGPAKLAELWDTPGLEDAGAALAKLRAHELETGATPAEALRHLLESVETAGISVRDAEPLETLLACDAGLIVFDVREPPRPKYWEEHELLRLCGVPLFAVLNCTAQPGALTDDWDRSLRAQGLHSILHYDAWAASEADAQELFAAVGAQLSGDKQRLLERLRSEREREERRAVKRSAEGLAQLLVDSASYRAVCRREDADREAADARIAGAIDAGWNRYRAVIAEIWRLDEAQLAEVEAAISRGGEQSGALAGLGVRAGGALGALGVGATIDVASGGATLGLGTLGGAALGGGVLGKAAWRKATLASRGEEERRVSADALKVLLRRGLWLLRRVRLYGVASERKLDPAPAGRELGESEASGLGVVLGRLERIRRGLGQKRSPLDDAAVDREESAEAAVRDLGRGLAELARVADTS